MGHFKRVLFLVLYASLLPFLIREILQRRKVTALLFHDIAPDRLDHQLAALTRRYRFISLREYLEARNQETTGHLPAKAAVLTFDDGHAGNAALLPVFRKFGVHPTIFVCTGVVGTRRAFWFDHPAAAGEVRALVRLPDAARRARLAERGYVEDGELEERQGLSWEEMDAMRDWVDFQPHTRFHSILPRCEEERAWREIAYSKSDLEERGYPVRCFAYPDGAYGEREEALVRKAGYASAMTVDLGFNAANTDPYRLMRICLNDRGSVIENLVKASGLWGWLITFVPTYRSRIRRSPGRSPRGSSASAARPGEAPAAPANRETRTDTECGARR